MNRRIYVRLLLDKYTGMKFHISVTGDSAESYPHRVVESHEQLVLVFQRARLAKLIRGIGEAVKQKQDYDSGPINITQEQEDTLLGRR